MSVTVWRIDQCRGAGHFRAVLEPTADQQVFRWGKSENDAVVVGWRCATGALLIGLRLFLVLAFLESFHTGATEIACPPLYDVLFVSAAPAGSPCERAAGIWGSGGPRCPSAETPAATTSTGSEHWGRVEIHAEFFPEAVSDGAVVGSHLGSENATASPEVGRLLDAKPCDQPEMQRQ